MFAGCIERMRQGSCGGCERREACAARWRQPSRGVRGWWEAPQTERRRWEAPQGARPSWGFWPEAQPLAVGDNPILAFFSDMAKAFEPEGAPTPARPEPVGPGREQPSAFHREVERRLEPLLASGPVRIDRIARELGCSRQTLYRRLKVEGVTFAELLDGLRRRLALRFIHDEGQSVKEAAYRLGFSDPAAFSRAFKRWTGRSPSAMRGKAE